MGEEVGDKVRTEGRTLKMREEWQPPTCLSPKVWRLPESPSCFLSLPLRSINNQESADGMTCFTLPVSAMILGMCVCDSCHTSVSHKSFLVIPWPVRFPLSVQHAPLPASAGSVRPWGPESGSVGVEGGEDEGGAAGPFRGGVFLQRRLVFGAEKPRRAGSRPPHVDRWDQSVQIRKSNPKNKAFH